MQRYSSSIVLLVLLCIVFCAHPKKIPGRKLLGKMRKKAKNAKKPYFYKVKRRKITHADAKKCEKWEQMLFVLLCIVFCAHPRKIPGRKLLGKKAKKSEKNAKKNLIFIR